MSIGGRESNGARSSGENSGRIGGCTVGVALVKNNRRGLDVVNTEADEVCNAGSTGADRVETLEESDFGL